MKITDKIASINTGVIIVLIAVTLQAFMSFAVFYKVSPYTGEARLLSSVLYSILVSFIILYFTFNKRVRVAKYLSIYEVYINLYVLISYAYDNDNLIALIPIIPIAVIVPYGLYNSCVLLKEKENEESEIETETEEKQERTKSNGRMFTDEQIVLIKQLKESGLSYAKIGELTGAHLSTIEKIVNGKRYGQKVND